MPDVCRMVLPHDLFHDNGTATASNSENIKTQLCWIARGDRFSGDCLDALSGFAGVRLAAGTTFGGNLD